MSAQSGPVEALLISSYLFSLFFPKRTTATPQLIMDLITSRCRAAVLCFQSRRKNGLRDEEYEFQWYGRMAGELVSGSSYVS